MNESLNANLVLFLKQTLHHVVCMVAVQNTKKARIKQMDHLAIPYCSESIKQCLIALQEKSQ